MSPRRWHSTMPFTGFSFFHCVASPFHSFVTTMPFCRPGPLSRLRRRVTAAGRDDQVQGRPGYRGASKSSWLPSRRPSHDLLRQQRLHCICTPGGPRSRELGAPGSATQTQRTWRCQAQPGRRVTLRALPSVMRPPGIAVRKAPAGPPDELRSLAASRCPWVVLRC